MNIAQEPRTNNKKKILSLNISVYETAHDEIM